MCQTLAWVQYLMQDKRLTVYFSQLLSIRNCLKSALRRELMATVLSGALEALFNGLSIYYFC